MYRYSPSEIYDYVSSVTSAGCDTGYLNGVSGKIILLHVQKSLYVYLITIIYW